jgi:hypothetical protein
MHGHLEGPHQGAPGDATRLPERPGKLVLIATNKGTLKAETPTRLSFVLTPQAKQHLGKATATIPIFGSVRSVPKSRPTANYSVGWSSKLT